MAELTAYQRALEARKKSKKQYGEMIKQPSYEETVEKAKRIGYYPQDMDTHGRTADQRQSDLRTAATQYQQRVAEAMQQARKKPSYGQNIGRYLTTNQPFLQSRANTVLTAEQQQKARESGAYDRDELVAAGKTGYMSDAFLRDYINRTREANAQARMTQDPIRAARELRGEYQTALDKLNQEQSQLPALELGGYGTVPALGTKEGLTERQRLQDSVDYYTARDRSTAIAQEDYDRYYTALKNMQERHASQEDIANAAELESLYGYSAKDLSGWNEWRETHPTYIPQESTFAQDEAYYNTAANTKSGYDKERQAVLDELEQVRATRQEYGQTLTQEEAARVSAYEAELQNQLNDLDTKISNEQTILDRYGYVGDVNATAGATSYTLDQARTELDNRGIFDRMRSETQSGMSTAEYGKLSEYDKSKGVSYTDEYDAMRQNAASTVLGLGKAAFGRVGGKYGEMLSGMADEALSQERQLYTWINDKTYRAATAETDEGTTQEWRDKGYDLLTYNERKEYNVRYNRDGAEAAQAFLDAMEPVLQSRRSSAMETYYEDMGRNLPITSTAVSTAAQLMSGIAAPIVGGATAVSGLLDAAGIKGAKIDKNSYIYDLAKAAPTLRAGTGEQLAEALPYNIPGTNTNAAAFLYNALMSGVDSVTAWQTSAGIAGMLGKGDKLAKAAMQTIMSNEAAVHTMVERLQNGQSIGRALAGGVMDGLIEAATETWSIEAMFSDPKNFSRYLIQNFAAEGSEELAGDVASLAVDELTSAISGRESEMRQQINAYMAQGMTEREAQAQAVSDWTQQTVLDTLAGAISGVGIAGAGAASNAIETRQTQRVLERQGVDSRTARTAAQELGGLIKPENGEEAVQSAVTQLEAKADETGERHNPFHAEATVEGMTDAKLEITGIAEVDKDGKVKVTAKGNGMEEQTLPLEQVKFASADERKAYELAAKMGDTQTARQYLAGYEESSLPVAVYNRAFNTVYDAGRNSRALTARELKVGYASTLSETVRQIAYNAGKAATEAQNVRLSLPAEVEGDMRTRLSKLPRTYAEGYTGVVYQAKNTQPTAAQAVMLDLLDGYGKKHGVHYTVVDTLDNGSNGVYTGADGGMVIALDAQEGYLTRVATHEGWHYIKENVREEAQGLQQYVLTLLQTTEGYDLEGRIAEKQRQYKEAVGQELNRDAALEELTADALYDAIATPENLAEIAPRYPKIVEKFMDFINNFVKEVRSLMRRISGKNPEARAMLEHEAAEAEGIIEEYNRLMEKAAEAEKKNHAREETGMERHQLRDSEEAYDYSKSFAEQVNDWMEGKFPQKDTLLLGRTPQVFRQIGLSDLPMTMDQTHLDYIINGSKEGHQMEMELVRQLPELLEHPLAIIESATHPEDSVVAIVNAETDGKHVTAAVRIDGSGKLNGIRIDANHMVSVQGRANAVTKLLYDAVKKENAGQVGVYFLDEKRGLSVLKGAGLQLPGSLNGGHLIHTIAEAESPVNRKYLEQTDTQQFKRWFKESKVVDENGRPLLMYHGTRTENGKFWEFDYSKAKRKGGLGFKTLGKGNYFTSKPLTGNERYGTRILECYLSIQKPVEATSLMTYHEDVSKILGREVKNATTDEIQNELRQKGYDGVILRADNGEIIFAVTFDSNQIKSATDNIGTFDASNPDIRYSLRDVDQNMDEVQRIVEENKTLLGMVSALQDQMQRLAGINEQLRQENSGLTGEHRMDYNQVKNLAREMKEKYESKVSVNDLAYNLQVAFNQMLNAQDSADSKAAMTAMSAIVRDMLEKSQRVDTTMYDEYKGMRKYLRTTPMRLTDKQWQEVRSRYGSEREFRNSVMGRLYIAAKSDTAAGTLDEHWNELAEAWPGMFDADTVEGDQVYALLDALDATAKKVENPYGMNLDSMTQDVTAEVYQQYLNIPEKKGRDAATVQRLMERLDKARAEARETTTRWSQRRAEMDEYHAMRREIIRQKQRILKKLQTPQAGSFVPYQMREAVEGLLNALGVDDSTVAKQTTLTADALRKAKEAYESVLPGGGEDSSGIPALADFYNGDLVTAFDELAATADGKKLNKLNAHETELLRNILNGYAAMIINEDRLFMQSKRESLKQTGDDFLARIQQREERMIQSKTKKFFSDALSRGLLTPTTVFGLFEGTEMEPVWRALRNAEWTHIRNVQSASEYLENALKEYDEQKEINMSPTAQLNGKLGMNGKRKGGGIEIKTDKGENLHLTREEAMTIYATEKREKLIGTRHLLDGGITFANTDGRAGQTSKEYKLTQNDLDKITGSLTAQQKAYVDHMVAYLSTTAAEWGNAVTRELYGVEKFNESYYIPLSVNRNYLKSDPAEQQDNRLKLGSFTKAITKNANNTVDILPFTQLWASHVEKMSDYNAFVLPIEDMTRLMNYRSEDGARVRKTIEERYGTQTREYIDSFLKRLNGNGRIEHGGHWINRFVSKAKGAAVTFNLSVAIQQAGAGPRAMAEINPKYVIPGIIAGFGKIPNLSKAYAEIEEHAPIAVEKGWGYFDTNMARGLYDRARSTVRGKVDDIGGSLAGKGDKFNWVQIWDAVKREVAGETGLKPGTDAYWQRCGERFTEVIDKTQVVDSIFQRAEWATEKGRAASFMSFLSEPIKQYNMLWRGLHTIVEGVQTKNKIKTKRGIKEFAKNAGGIAVSAVATAALKSIITALRDRDNEKKEEDEDGKQVIVGVRGFEDKYVDALLPNLMDNLTGLLPVFSTMAINAFSSDYGGGSSDLESAALDNTGKSVQYIKKGDYERALYYVLQAGSSAIGIGAGNAYRDVRALILTTKDAVERDTLAGAAWDTSKDFATRVKAATKNYVYAREKDENGNYTDERKAAPDLYADLMLAAYYESGMGKDFQTVAQAALDNGATEAGLVTKFKSKLRGSSDAVTEAAEAYHAGDVDGMNKYVAEIVGTGIGTKAAYSMIQSREKELYPEEKKKEPGKAENVVESLQSEAKDALDTTDTAQWSEATEKAATGDAAAIAELKKLVEKLRKEGYTDKELTAKVWTLYGKDYKTAFWNGDTAEAAALEKAMTGAGVGLTKEALGEKMLDASKTAMYEALRGGDVDTAKRMKAYVEKAMGSDAYVKALKQWAKTAYPKAMTNGTGATLKKALLAMGLAESTLDGYVK